MLYARLIRPWRLLLLVPLFLALAADHSPASSAGWEWGKLEPALRDLLLREQPPLSSFASQPLDRFAVRAARQAAYLRRVFQPAPGMVRVVVELNDASGAATLTEEIVRRGGSVEGVADTLVQARLPRETVESLAGVAVIRRVRLPWPVLPFGDEGDGDAREVEAEATESVEAPESSPNENALRSEAYALLGAANWNGPGRVRGQGVRVGILDVGFLGYVALEGREIAPPERVHPNFPPSFDNTAGSSNHGTAVFELLFDIAPWADYYLAGMSTEVEYVLAMQWLADQGVRVVNASIGFDNLTAMDGTGLFARQVTELAARDVVYVGAAGNERERYWTDTWRDEDNDRCHDIGLSDSIGLPTNALPVSGANSLYYLALRWAEPFGTAALDFNLELVRSDGMTVARGNDVQDGQGNDDDPVERIYYSAWTGDSEFTVRVCFDGPNPAAIPAGLALRVWNYGGLPAEYQTHAGSLSSPADAPDCLAVGAVRRTDLRVMPYSSIGPTADGRAKPDVYGLSDVSTTSRGAWQSDDEPGFAGTSAATPYVGGAAILVRSAWPDWTRAQVTDYLRAQVSRDIAGAQEGVGLVVLPPIADEPRGRRGCGVGTGAPLLFALALLLLRFARAIPWSS